MFKKNDFDNLIDRKNSRSEKWDSTEEMFKVKDLLPLWIADMDFKNAPLILQALNQKINHGIMGYSIFPDSYYESTINWFYRRYNWKIEKNSIIYTPGAMMGLSIAIQAFTNEKDKIILQDPIYPPFYSIIRSNKRKKVLNSLKLENNHYEIDFNDLKKKVILDNVKMIIFCNPHNPTGRVWRKEEIEQLGDICIDENLLVISDEINCDLVFPEYKFISFASISKKFEENSITCTSPSKGFNLSGIPLANIIIPSSELKTKFNVMKQKYGILDNNSLGSIALETAYNKCEDWLDDLKKYIKENLEFLKKFLVSNIPEVKVINPEATYLVWLDFRGLNYNNQTLERILMNEAKVLLWNGIHFGKSGKGFRRINIACPRLTLEKALNRIKDALRKNIR
ncbi:MAG: pyridoxal phosphate-dependent aminotransferase [Candidatus Lokiarchaeota archaeon]|nr:pyridoxal phosphate-dependent aminotransferase [Candidatus Lokiarchaeota archaeon]